MHNAPPVQVPVGRFLWGGHAVPAALAGLLTAGLGWWQGLSAIAQLCLLIVWAVVSVVGHRVWSIECPMAGWLIWDGQHWYWQTEHSPGGAREPVGVRVRWDAGNSLWLSLKATAPSPTWCLRHVRVDAWRDPVHWHAVRCAVHAQDSL